MINWRRLVEDEEPMVWQAVYRLLGHHAEAADCFQETFLTYLRFSRRQTVNELAAMLRKIAVSRAIDRIRRRWLDRQRHQEHVSELRETAAPDPSLEAQQAELVEAAYGAALAENIQTASAPMAKQYERCSLIPSRE